MYVLHGMSEISGQGHYTADGLKRNGITAELALFSDVKTPYGSDHILDKGDTEGLHDFAERMAEIHKELLALQAESNALMETISKNMEEMGI